MLNLNKFFLALAFLGGSAAVQAGDGRLDVARVEFSKTSEKLDDTNSWGARARGAGAFQRLGGDALFATGLRQPDGHSQWCACQPRNPAGQL